MSAALSLNDFYKLNHVLKITPPVLASNYSKFVSSFYPNNDCYSLLIVDDVNHCITGSISWGTSGFDFKVFLEKKTKIVGTKNKTYFDLVYVKYAHTAWTAIDDTNSDKILESFFKLSSGKADEVLAGIHNDWNGGRLLGYFFRKKPGAPSKPTTTFLTHLAHLHRSNTITQPFYDFVKKHENKLIISKH